jgi:hypothetical protein
MAAAAALAAQLRSATLSAGAAKRAMAYFQRHNLCHMNGGAHKLTATHTPERGPCMHRVFCRDCWSAWERELHWRPTTFYDAAADAWELPCAVCGELATRPRIDGENCS